MDCDTLENHIENQPEPDNSWVSKPEPIPPRTQLLVKLLSPEAKLPTRGSDDAAGYDLYSCEKILLEPRTRKLVNTGISIAMQEYGILLHSRTYYCLLFSLYHMFIIFVISY